MKVERCSGGDAGKMADGVVGGVAERGMRSNIAGRSSMALACAVVQRGECGRMRGVYWLGIARNAMIAFVLCAWDSGAG
ncbi:MAG: hypothetical protein WCQ96_01565 [Patescibacteria group bacterium]